MKSSLNLFFIFFLLLSFTSLISAVPPQTSVASDTGINIEHPIQEVRTINTDFTFHFHNFNVTDGKPFPGGSSGIQCIFHLYNQTGSHIYIDENVTYDDIYDYEIKVKGKNFSTTGQYSYVFQCNNSDVGGYFANSFEVTPTGDIEKSILDNPLLIFLAILGLGLAVLGINMKLPWIGFIGSIIFILLGIYIMIYGFGDSQSLYTKASGLVIIGMGFIFMFTAAYEWLQNE